MSGAGGRDGGVLGRALIVGGGIVLLAIGYWTLALPRAEKTIFARVPLLDEIYYLDRAADLAGASTVDESQPYFVSPLYPRLLSGVGVDSSVPENRVFQPADLRAVRVFQIGLWLGTALLLRLIAGRAFRDDDENRTLAEPWLWLPTLLFMSYRPAAIYSLTILLELPLVFLLTCYLALLVFPRSRWWVALGLGVVVGTATLLRGTAFALLPAALVILWRSSPGSRSRVRQIGLLTLGALVVLGPAVVHNSRLAGRLCGPTLNGGVNLFVGNGPQANGFYVAAIPGDWRSDPAGREYLTEVLGRPAIDLAEADRFWMQAALDSMADAPFRTLALWAKKVWLHLQGWEIDQLTPLAGWARDVGWLRWLVTPYWMLVAAAIVGLWNGRGTGAPVVIWGGLLLLLIGTQSFFFVVSRYRLVLVPLLALLAAGAAGGLSRGSWSAGRLFRQVFAPGLVACILVVPWGLGSVQEMWRTLADANEARRWAMVGEAEADAAALARAEMLYQRVLSTNPPTPAVWLGLAAVLDLQDDQRGREEILTRALLYAQGDLDIRKSLISLLLAQGRHQEALVQVTALLRDHPGDGDTLHNSVILLAESGRRAAALAAADRLIEAQPSDPRGYLDKGILLARAGRVDEARQAFASGLEACPEHPDLLKNLSLLPSN